MSSRVCFNIEKIIVRKAAKIRNQYNRVPHLTQDTTWESDKNQEVSPFQAGDHKAAMNRHESRTNTRHNTNDPQKYLLGTVSKNILLEGLNQFHGANLTLNSDVDQDIFGKVTQHTTIGKRSALSQQVTTRLQGTDTSSRHTIKSSISYKNNPPWNSEIFTGGLKPGYYLCLGYICLMTSIRCPNHCFRAASAGRPCDHRTDLRA